MASLKNLIDWNQRTQIVQTLFNSPLGVMTHFIDANPLRIGLHWNVWFAAVPISFLPEDVVNPQQINVSGYDLSLLIQYWDVNKHYKLATCGWSMLSSAVTPVTVTEILLLENI